MRRMRALGWGVVVAVLVLSGTAQAATQVSTSDRLKDRREVTAGTRAYSIGFEDGRFYANGWHITGEMGGVWAPPLKLADGVWFGVDDQWVGPATTFTSGQGYTRYSLKPMGGLLLRRTDFVPDGRRAALFGLELANPTTAAKTVTVKVDTHSELLGAYPWSGSTGHPTAADNLQDSAAFRDGALVFTDTGSLPGAEAHDYTALVGSTRTPEGADLGPGFRGPQPGTVCKDGDTVAPSACDDGPHGKGTGGQLRYKVTVPAKGREAVWIAVAGSDAGMTAAKRELTMALRDPDAQLATKIAARERLAAHSVVDLPGDRTLQDAVEWGKQNLADLTQSALEAEDPLRRPGQGLPGAGDRDQARDVHRRRLPRLPVAVRHRRRVLRVPGRRARAVRDDPRAPDRAARRLRRAQREVRQGRPRDRHRRLRLLRRQHRRRQHRRVGQVRLGRRAGLALDGRQPLPRRPLRLLRAHPALRHGEARRRQGRLAGGARQRRARRHGPGEARQRRLPDPRPLRPRRHGEGQGATAPRRSGPRAWRASCAAASTRRGGTRNRSSTRTRSTTPTTRRSSSSTGSGSRRWRPS